jgi:tetratricopeptide (TPR) repeat protein
VSRSSPSSPSGPSQRTRPPREQLEEADRLRQQGKLDRAEALCYPLASRNPGYVAALHTLGLIYLDKGSYERALDCLVRASMRDPTSWMSLTALSLAYLRLGATEMAAQTLERALAIRPQDAAIFASLGEVHREQREHDLAQQAYRQALTLDPNLQSAAIGLALCLQALGQPAEAASVLSTAYARGHRSLDLLHVMTTLPPNAVQLDLLGALDELAGRTPAADATFKNNFLFARAAALDAAGRHAEAWQTLEAANRPLAAQHQAELKADIARRERALAWLRGAPVAPPMPTTIGEQPVSLFIVGPSRSGKTSLERLVSAWDGIEAGCETPIVERSVRRAFHASALPPSNDLEDLPPSMLPQFRNMYLDELARRAPGARLLTNTLPGRIHDAGLIAATIPNVRFLLIRRNADDVALRVYMTKYLSGNSYAYDLKSIRDYLNWYDTMIDLTAQKLPDITRVVSDERMVDDPAATLREVARLCGVSAPDVPAPTLGHDRGCAVPYKSLMAGG